MKLVELSFTTMRVRLAVATSLFVVCFLPAQEETEDYYRRWLEQDVIYIITPEERDVFLSLETDEERERFIEQFWFRRDPDPATSVNEFKEEHYRRIAHSNENYTSGFPGWKTDRGMIYIKFGPPDRIHANPTGGDYQRPYHEGGGSTQTYPWERWEYRHLEGIGDDVEIEFVDDTLSGEYRMTTNPHDKDALLRIPNAGLTEAEMSGLVVQKLDRIVLRTNPMPGHNPLGAGVGRLKDQPFERLQLVTDLQKAPPVDFSDLRALVETRVRYDQVPFRVRSHSFYVSPDRSRVLITLYIESKDLSYRDVEDHRVGTVEVYGAFRSLTGKVVQDIEDTLTARIPTRAGRSERLLYQREVFLPPGRYKLQMVVKDAVADRLGTLQRLVEVPEVRKEELDLSSIILADRVEVVQAAGGRPASRYRIWPLDGNRIGRGRKLGFYCEVYNFEVDQSTQEPDLEISYELVSAGGAVLTPLPEFNSIDVSSDRINVVIIIPPGVVEPGSYSLRIKLRDAIAGRQMVQAVPVHLE